ncbi:MAG: glycosyl hydrolase 53 family protein, partial [Muribaculaceae bacterium]|nr:glycosyl hydrolase 53 family protein [Muribaculaceae bacterium]
MISIISAFALATASLCGISSQEIHAANPAPTESATTVKKTDFACGADVSWLTQMESEGRKFYTRGNDRKEMECMQLLRDYCGVNSIRLRVWVNPKDRWNSIDDVVE